MKIHQLTFFRFAAALVIVVVHFGSYVTPFKHPLLSGFVEIGNSAVSFFFMLSGFVLAFSNWETVVVKKTFYWNRFLRVYPVYFLALVLFLFPRFAAGVWPADISVASVAMQVGMVQAIFADHATELNFPGWSLSVEICLYLLFPFLFQFLRTRPAKTIVVTCAITWIATFGVYAASSEQLLPIPWNYANFFPAFHVSTFLTGVGAGVLFRRHREFLNLKTSQRVITATLLTFATLFSVLILMKSPILKYYHGGLFDPFFLATILLFALDKAPAKKFLASRPLVILGESSYALYILQLPLWNGIFYFAARNNVMGFFDFYVNTALVIVGSVVAHALIERPLQRNFKIAR